jgi:hypothetical protein
MFERKIIRRIYGPVMENNVCRIRYNEELNTLMKGEDIVRVTENKMVGPRLTQGCSAEWQAGRYWPTPGSICSLPSLRYDGPPSSQSLYTV